MDGERKKKELLPMFQKKKEKKGEKKGVVCNK
jgi:hypothetical protein